MPNSQSSSAHHDEGFPSILALFLRMVPLQYFARLLSPRKRRHNDVFTLPMVIWLMIFQRLDPKGTLSAAVQQVISGNTAVLVVKPSKRLREHTVSGNTGGYNQARHKLPLEVVRQVSDEMFEQLRAVRAHTSPESSVPMFILDGSTILMPNTPALREAYPPSRNQYGESHWPIMRVLVAHELRSGVAVRPESGPANGPKALSEQQLTGPMLDRLPTGAGIMGDRNFGVFSVAWEAQQRHRPVLLRLTETRAQHAFGLGFCSGTDCKVDWKASKHDRTRHPELPRDACAHGRLLVRTVYPNDGSASFKLYLFTTLDLPADEIFQSYGLRWDVETDLRTIKKTIRLEMLDCETPEMVAKELVVAIMAYNLVRAVIDESARQTGMNPREYSFSRVQDVVNAWLPLIASKSSESERQAATELMMKYVAQCKLYKRKKRKSYPRKLWLRRRSFPVRRCAPLPNATTTSSSSKKKGE